MTDIRRDLLLQQGRLVLALILATADFFWSHGFFADGEVSARTPSLIYALMLSTSATPVFGLAVSNRSWSH